jgi:hypothetical protein
MSAQTKLAQCIARQEGWGQPGNVPTVRNNPGDLRHTPHSRHPDPAKPNEIGWIDTIEHGWEDCERQLGLYAGRGKTIVSMIWEAWAPPNENNSAVYVENICRWMGMAPDTPVSVALKVPAIPWEDILAL